MPSEVTVPSLAHALNRKGLHFLCFPRTWMHTSWWELEQPLYPELEDVRQESRAALQTTTLQRGKLETSFYLPKPLYFGIS